MRQRHEFSVFGSSYLLILTLLMLSCGGTPSPTVPGSTTDGAPDVGGSTNASDASTGGDSVGGSSADGGGTVGAGGTAVDSGTSGCPADMATIPAGTWISIYDVNFVVDAFCLDLTEVTVDAYRSCVTAGACSTDTYMTAYSGCNWSASDRGDHPLNCVDWNQATAFCQQAGKRLPTDKEMFWAGRDGDHGYTYPWGNDAPNGQVCWSGVTTLSSTCPVGSYPAGNNRYGVADLVGNVLEWTSTGDSRNQGQYLAVGGSWYSSIPTDLVRDGLLATGTLPASTGSAVMGFRCAR
jgi:hypothetical protein